MSALRQIIIIKLDGFLYGVPVDLIQEVISSNAERSLPEAPNFIEGVSYIRGSLVPIIRLKRLFNSIYFDLYSNKKIIIMNFSSDPNQGVQSEKDVLEFQNIRQLGILVDEVVGIDSYLESDVKAVTTVYDAVSSDYITGFITRKNKDIAIFDIQEFLFNIDGSFKYLRYMRKSVKVLDEFNVENLQQMKELFEKVNFPINNITKKLLIQYFSKVARLEEKTVSEYFYEYKNRILHNSHFQLNQKHSKIFRNKADMQVISEYFSKYSISSSSSSINILTLDSGDGFNIASIALITGILKKTGFQYLLTSMGFDEDLVENQDFIYDRASLEAIPLDLHERFFEIKEDKYILKSRIRSTITKELVNIEKLVEQEKKFHLIYAPNFLLRDIDKVGIYVQQLEKLLVKDGILMLGLFEDIYEYVRKLKKYYIKSRLVFIKG